MTTQLRDDMNVVFLGGMFSQDTDAWIRQNSKGNIHNAANVMQWNLLRGLRRHLGTRLHVISSPFIGSFPKLFKWPVLRDFRFALDSGSQAQGIGFLNLPIVKHVSRYLRLGKPISHALDSSDSPQVVIAYSFSAVMAFSLKRAKRAHPSIVTCLVVADLPEFMNLSANKRTLRTVLGDLTIKRLYKTLDYVDCAVVLTEPMATRMRFTKPYVVTEGIAEDSDSPGAIAGGNAASNDNEHTVLYTGGLNEAFGVVNLVKAFSTLEDPALRLVLCGTGDAVETIQRYAQADHRIIYRGLLPRDEILALQKQATVLVNPRQNTGEYVKYSFPSKLMEYMASGTPVVAYDLAGMPSEYREHLVLVPDNDLESLAETIQQVASQTAQERRAIGQSAREFVLTQKNPETQAKKILQMLADVSTHRLERHGRV